MTRQKILVVDSDEQLRDVFLQILEGEGYLVETAATAEAAWAILGSGEKPALILLDVMMPRMEAISFLSRVRNHEQFKEIPVVATADRDINEVSAILARPLSLDTILNATTKYCEAKGSLG